MKGEKSMKKKYAVIPLTKKDSDVIDVEGEVVDATIKSKKGKKGKKAKPTYEELEQKLAKYRRRLYAANCERIDAWNQGAAKSAKCDELKDVLNSILDTILQKCYGVSEFKLREDKEILRKLTA